jgi:succinate-semialdehyde dehydrogenase/glutarate-semialdehyde dehydrogenase
MLIAINPATGELNQEYAEHSEIQVHQFIEHAHQQFLLWSRESFRKRATVLKKVAGVLGDRTQELSILMSKEMGKPLAEGRKEIDKCARVCEFYAENAEKFLAPEMVRTEARKSFVTFQPLGVILAVMPWNFPFWQVFRFAAPVLAAGNAAVLKHASNVPGCALAIESVFNEAGLPAGLFKTLMIGSERVNSVLENPRVCGVALTGSTPAGRLVASKAASLLKKSVLELGGSDPYLILEDADLEVAAKCCVASRLINAGQSCIAAKRLIVVEAVRLEFEKVVVAEMVKRKMGDPLVKDTEIGPMARSDLRDELHAQVIKTIEAGARCLLGGKPAEGPGAFYPPTILTNVQKGMPAYSEELFGPVAVIIPAQNEREAIDIANDTSFGLGAAVFTKDLDKGERIAACELKAGSVFVNDYVKSDPRLPFGGIKDSGFGRELAIYGIREFVNIKTVVVR